MLPNLIVIGAMKAGTTSLHHYLSLHPEIYMSEDKEPSFFTVEKNWHRGVSWYSSLFPTDDPVRGEASPDYTKFPAIEGVPKRIHAVVPETRLIYVVREPIERIVSHYIDAYSFGRVHLPINRELASYEHHHFVNCSRYRMQLEQYVEYFDVDRILVVTTEELRDERRATMRAVFECLGVAHRSRRQGSARCFTLPRRSDGKRGSGTDFSASPTLRRGRLRPYLSPRLMAPIRAINTRTAPPIPRPELDACLRSELADYLRPDVEWLRAFTGKALATWVNA